jgi:hypothetical protein
MLNPDTGKRQRSTSGPALPAKKDKPDVPTYDQYEREFLQANVLGSNVTAADRERVSSVSRRIPPELHAKYKKTLMYRHPVWKALPTPSSDMLNSLHSLQWPTDCMDLSTSTLLDPVVPPGTSPPGISFAQYDRIRTYVDAKDKFANLPDLPADAQKELDGIPSDARIAYDIFYASTHPESMGSVNSDIKEGLYEAILNMCPISYEDN